VEGETPFPSYEYGYVAPETVSSGPSDLDIGIILASDFEIIPRTCHLLEHMNFDLEGRAYLGMSDLFTKCPHFKTCLGLKHVIRASDMTDDLLPWTCLGLQELDLEISDVARLSTEEERILDTMQTEGRIEPKDGQEQSTISSRELSTEEQSLMYCRLGRCTELTHLHPGIEKRTTYLRSEGASEVTTNFKSQLTEGKSYHGLREWPLYANTLELSLESGLAELRTLRRLEDLGLSYVDHQIGIDEMEWTSQSWFLKVVSGIWVIMFEATRMMVKSMNGQNRS
jgi:hypothetical protein